MTSVFWTEAALAQLAGIQDYIGQTSPVYAARMIERIFARGPQLASSLSPVGRFPNAATPHCGKSSKAPIASSTG